MLGAQEKRPPPKRGPFRPNDACPGLAADSSYIRVPPGPLTCPVEPSGVVVRSRRQRNGFVAFCCGNYSGASDPYSRLREYVADGCCVRERVPGLVGLGYTSPGTRSFGKERGSLSALDVIQVGW